jgi:penicillin-binding protein 1C
MYSRFDDDQPPPHHPPPPAGNAPPLTMPNGLPAYQMPAAPIALPPPRKRRWNGACLGCALVLLAMVGTTFCSVTAGVVIVWNVWSREISAKMQKEFEAQNAGTTATGVPSKAFQTTYIYDRNGNELHQIFQEGRRTRVRLTEIAKPLIDATIAVEDSTFYDNPGVDVAAITRAGLNYFRAGGGGGASTITQQLVRNVVFDFEYRAERSARRKLEEVVMAVILTREKTKDEILEIYLNTIYYGNLAYGIEAASQTYFGKSSKDLTLAEAALLAGLPQSPANYDPFNPDPEIQDIVLTRRNTVLGLMVDKGKITQAQADAARREALVYANPNISLKSPHFTLFAEQELQDLLPAINLPPTYLTTGGLKVYTTLDAGAQDMAEKVARAQIESIREKHNARNAAVVVLKPTTGEIIAMVGSVDYRDDSIDGRVNVAISPRQPGSAMKPLTYAAAIERGISPAAIFWDVETRISNEYGGAEYVPLNYDRTFHGPVRMRDALANSYNIPAVKTLRLIGVEALLAFSERMGVRSLGMDTSKYGLSLTLGGGELTPLELTRAYAVFANEGKLVPTTTILCVINNEGQVVYQYENGCAGRGTVDERTINAAASGRQVLDPRIAFLIRDFLGDNAARTPAMGARSPLRTDGLASSSKTGTTNNYRDNWTVGFTRNVAVGVWVGNTDSTEMKGTTGLTGAAPIWNAVITGLYNTPGLTDTLTVNGALLPEEIVPPAGVSLRRVCAMSSVREPAYDCDRGRREYMLDSLPLIPDENGNLGEQIAIPPTPIPQNGPRLESVDGDPGVVRALVFPLNPAIAASLVDPNASGARAYPPPPLYCLVPHEVGDQLPGAVSQVFILSSPFGDEDVYNRLYAQGAGYAILPPYPCNTEMLAGGPSAPGVAARITWPAPGETVTGTVFVKGIASWSPGGAWYFKMEIQGPQFPDFTTFSGPTEYPVINGDLGNFGAGGLQPGMYQLRIVIVGVDGNYLMTSAPVPVNITGG